MFDMDLSGLQRLEKVAEKLGGNHKYEFTSVGNIDLTEKETSVLSEEFLKHVMNDERSQDNFLRTRSSSYYSKKLGRRITVRQVS